MLYGTVHLSCKIDGMPYRFIAFLFEDHHNIATTKCKGVPTNGFLHKFTTRLFLVIAGLFVGVVFSQQDNSQWLYHIFQSINALWYRTVHVSCDACLIALLPYC